MKKTMTKNDLMTSDVVLSTKGSYGVVLRGTPKGDVIKWFLNNKCEVIHKFRSFNMINDDLSFRFNTGDKIVKVYRVTDQHDMTTMNAINENYVIYENKIKEVTMDDLEKMYGCKVKIVNKDV